MIEAPVNVARRGGREGRKESKLPGRSCRTGRLAREKKYERKRRKERGNRICLTSEKLTNIESIGKVQFPEAK